MTPEGVWNRGKSLFVRVVLFFACFGVFAAAAEVTPNTEKQTVNRNGDGDAWWSLQLARTAPPKPSEIPNAWKENPIDRFVFAALADRGLLPNGPADRRTLIRRLTYDLTGLPPSPGEVERFVSDPDPNKYEKLVDRLLASPHYGERWGRHWLDVVRFGESRGFERNEIISNAWPFRDYVIQSFNQDKPFNQFIVEHIAGDVVGKGRPDVEGSVEGSLRGH